MTIWKYELVLEYKQVIQMPDMAKILDVQIQRGKICVWAMVDPNQILVQRVFYIVGTGNNVSDEITSKQTKHIGTVQSNEYVWHVFVSN